MNALVLQCGGPTAVINASLAGVIGEWQQHRPGKLFGCRTGLGGLIEQPWPELTDLPQAVLEQLCQQPGMALGGGRYRLRDEEFPRIFQRLAEQQIELFFVIGGNGSMAAAQALAEFGSASGLTVAGRSLRVIGIPRTMDNDLAGTEVAPGYASTARFIAQTTHDITCDLYSMRDFDDVGIYEVMGRHAGWVAAAAALARQPGEDAPELILLPEVPVDEEKLLSQVEAVLRQKGVCLIVAGEGAKDLTGAYLAEKQERPRVDPSGQRAFTMGAGLSAYLGNLIGERLGVRCRRLRPDTIQRSSSYHDNPLDQHLAWLAGQQAVQTALRGETAVMIGLRRSEEQWSTVSVPFAQIVGVEHPLPNEFINFATFDVTEAFLHYARPLVGAIKLQSVWL